LNQRLYQAKKRVPLHLFLLARLLNHERAEKVVENVFYYRQFQTRFVPKLKKTEQKRRLLS
jgi:hypothetical protein